jgi:hypothetical protein
MHRGESAIVLLGLNSNPVYTSSAITLSQAAGGLQIPPPFPLATVELVNCLAEVKKHLKN